MSTNPVTLDFGQADPIGVPAAPQQAQPSGSPVTLDFANADPIGAQSQPEVDGEQTNDVGNSVVVPKANESFADTMKRAAAKGKTTTQDQLNAEEQTIPAKLGEEGAVFATAALPEAIGQFGSAITGKIAANLPAITEAATNIGQWAKANPMKSLGVMWAINKGLDAVGLPKASHLVESLELPALLLLGKGPATEVGEGAEAAEAAAPEAEASAPEAAPAIESTATPEATPEPATEATPQQLGTYNQTPDENGSMESEDADAGYLTKAEKQAKVDKYFAEHPDKKPQPVIAKRGPNKGQVKTYRVFMDGKWVTHPVMK